MLSGRDSFEQMLYANEVFAAAAEVPKGQELWQTPDDASRHASARWPFDLSEVVRQLGESVPGEHARRSTKRVSRISCGSITCQEAANCCAQRMVGCRRLCQANAL
ncbi:hypothetical protein Xcc3_44140 [Xanthomonas campestris pv. campestris]|nr:hypothetical protein Xcc1_43280 [Xanthomonas campestris pv. campestris]BBK03107.1 hypothetical protein Xcc3_44140 [Xanthomonas campestris pv. campestris]